MQILSIVTKLLKNTLTDKIKMTTMNGIWSKVCDLIKMLDYHLLFIILLSFTILAYFDFKIGKEAYFYTLSTISQTLAALIGIVAIFVIFKLDLLKTERSDSIERLENLLKSDLVGSVVQQCRTTPRYMEICAVIDNFYIDYSIDDVVFGELSTAIENLGSDVINLDMNKFIRRSEKIIKNIGKIDNSIKNIPLKFSKLIIVVFSTIILSILALPFGWSIVPIGIISNLSILKLPVVALIVNLTVLSIFQTKRFFENVMNSKY